MRQQRTILGEQSPWQRARPNDPTEQEVEDHKLTGHACFRSWCRHCVRGRRSEAAHSSIKPPPSALPILSWDYCYLSTREDAKAAWEAAAAVEGPEFSAESPVLVMWDNKGKGVHAHIVPAKGVDYEGFDKVVKLLCGDLD